MDNAELTQLTGDIVSAHVANNSVAVSELPDLIEKVHRALTALTRAGEAKPEKKEPVVSVRASVKPDYIICMECGREQRTLKRHLRVAHGMTPEEYRKGYGLPQSYPMSAPNSSEQRRQLAKDRGLGRKNRPTGSPN